VEGLDDPELLDECNYLCGEDPYHHKDCPLAKLLRGTWCTPKWLADLLGWIDVDPCSNERSHVRAQLEVRLADDGDGLYDLTVPGSFKHRGQLIRAERFNRVFVNPPYAHGEVIKWVLHYLHTRFMYLLRWDPSTEWFWSLMQVATHVWFPERRIDFEPPPRIKSSSNPFPHGLYMRDPPTDLLARLKPRGYLLVVDSWPGKPQSAPHGHQQPNRAGSASAGGGGAAADTGAGGGWEPARRGLTGPGPCCINRQAHVFQCCEVCE
jgi:hypothetical protein